MFNKKWTAKTSWTPMCGDTLVDTIIKVRNYGDDFFSKELTDPFAYEGVSEAVSIIKELPKGSKLCIVGDYDCDGVISTFILVDAFTKLGYVVDYILPDRFVDGYGISDNIINRLEKAHYDLIITCDNGITYTSQFKEIHASGTKVIITDHHQPQLVDYSYVDVIIDPHMSKDTDLFKDLCGAGVALYLVIALGFPAEDYIDYAAIATVCDSVPLLGDNRVIVSHGLNNLPYIKNNGLQALYCNANIKGKGAFTVYDLGFIIGPRINATGRLAKADLALSLLLTQSQSQINYLANTIEELNVERQHLTNEGVKIANNIIEMNFQDDKVIAVYAPDIHESVQGIVAGKLTEKYNLPSIVLTVANNGKIKGSARSIPGFNIYDYLCEYSQLLDRFGGHPSAAGLSMSPDNVIEFVMKATWDSHVDKPPIRADVELNLSDITVDDIKSLSKLEPHGYKNSKPTFSSICTITKLIQYDKCIQLVIDNNMRTPIFDNLSEFKEELIKSIGENYFNTLLSGQGNLKAKIFYTLTFNKYNGKEYIQPMIKYLQLV